jgi:MFS family permease
MQENLGFSPVKTGLSFLPLTGALVITSTTVQTKLVYRTGAKPLVAVGMALGSIAMLLLTRLAPGASYASHVLPALVITGLGMGCVFAPAFSTATLGVDGSEAGVASAMVNTSQQVGGSVGTALLSTIFASSTAAYASSHIGTPGVVNAATIHGYTTAFAWAAGIFALGLALALLILPARGKSSSPAPAEAVDHRTAAASRPAAPATAILVTGPCCHFAVTVHVEHITLLQLAPEELASTSRGSSPAKLGDPPPPAPT